MTFTPYITPLCLAKIDYYTSAALPTEIGGLCKIDDRGDGNIFVMDIHAFPQEATGGTFDIKSEDINDFVSYLVKNNRADEIHMWCGIWHGHPSSMTAHMSGPDVAAIERFAMEQDAFSLIMTANPKPGNAVQHINTDKLLMHYCGNVRGSKVIISDMKVHLAYMNERSDVGADIAKSIVAHYNLSESDASTVEGLVHTFATETLPGLWQNERDALALTAKEDVAKLIKRPIPLGFNRNNQNSYHSNFQGNTWKGHGWYGEAEAEDENDWLDYEWTTRSDELKNDVSVERHNRMIQLANGIDPATGKACSKNKQKKARKFLDRKAAKAIRRLPSLESVDKGWNVGDWVTVMNSGIDRAAEANNIDEGDLLILANLYGTPEKIEIVGNRNMEVVYKVAGYWFYPEELQTFDMSNLTTSEVYG